MPTQPATETATAGWEALPTYPQIDTIERGLAKVALRHGEPGDASVIFNHTVIGSYEKLSGVKGIELYDGRALAATEPGDEIHLPAELKKEFPDILDHYRDIGLEVTKNAAFDRTLADVVNEDPAARRTVSVFLFGEEANQVSPNERRYQAVRRLNDKNEFIGDMQDAGLPVPETHTFAHGELPPEVQPDDGFSGPWFVKGAVAASGMEVVKCDTWQEVLDASHQMEAHYQVQHGVEADDFLNIQYYINDGAVYHVATTGQILEGAVHAGNRHPANHGGVRGVTDQAARIAADMGAEGLIAFDAAAVKAPSDGSAYHPYQLIECNPRPNGASYPTAAAEKLGVRDKEWAAVNVPVYKDMPLSETVRLLNAAGLSYDPAAKTGAAIVNWGTTKDGKLGILFVGPPDLQSRQHQLAKLLIGTDAWIGAEPAVLEKFKGESWIDT